MTERTLATINQEYGMTCAQIGDQTVKIEQLKSSIATMIAKTADLNKEADVLKAREMLKPVEAPPAETI